MAKILTTKGNAAELEDIIRKAEKEIFLISFSFIISDSFIVRLKQAAEKGIVVHLVYGKSIKSDSYQQVLKMPNVKVYFLENLHAKIFANESKCIVGSMNFSEASEINNHELGVMLSLQNDKDAYTEVMQHCREIISMATLEKSGWLRESSENEIKKSKPTLSGYCIRTGKKIPLNHEKPFSADAYALWAEWSDEHYKEKFDHFTGEKSNGETCMATPIMSKNWKKYQKTVQG